MSGAVMTTRTLLALALLWACLCLWACGAPSPAAPADAGRPPEDGGAPPPMADGSMPDPDAAVLPPPIFVPGGTSLDELAARLAPGEWAELETEGFGTALLSSCDDHSIFEWANDAIWDPI